MNLSRNMNNPKLFDADAFIAAWKEFTNAFVSGHPAWQKAYQDNASWSKLFLGGKKSTSKGSPIGDFFSEKHDFRYRTEDGSFDIALSTAKNYNELPIHLDDSVFYPRTYDIIIEIENYAESAWQEMTKLTWVRCRLKVLITYHFNKDESKWDTENEMLIKSFETIIKQSGENIREDDRTEYLLIIGNDKYNTLNWKYVKFDSKGNPTCI